MAVFPSIRDWLADFLDHHKDMTASEIGENQLIEQVPWTFTSEFFTFVQRQTVLAVDLRLPTTRVGICNIEEHFEVWSVTWYLSVSRCWECCIIWLSLATTERHKMFTSSLSHCSICWMAATTNHIRKATNGWPWLGVGSNLYILGL